jgi:integrase
MLSYAHELGLRGAPPRINLREEQGRETLIDPWVEGLLLKHASAVLHDVIAIMLDCGMRPEEVGRMRWENIRWMDSAILVPFGKTMKARRLVPLTDRMHDVLAGAKRRNEKRNHGDSPWVFPTRSKSGHMEWFSAVWERTLERIKQPLPEGLVLYSARHTFATNYLKAGGDLGQLMRIMGHSDIRTTQKYLHLIEASGAAQVMNRHNERKLEIVRKRA